MTVGNIFTFLERGKIPSCMDEHCFDTSLVIGISVKAPLVKSKSATF
jgi:hypothetical protein